jgi:hypothetical protein
MGWRLKIIWIPGKTNLLADAASRYFVQVNDDGPTILRDRIYQAQKTLEAFPTRVQDDATPNNVAQLEKSIYEASKDDPFISVARTKLLSQEQLVRRPVDLTGFTQEELDQAERDFDEFKERLSIRGEKDTVFFQGEGDRYPRRVIARALRKGTFMRHHASLFAMHRELAAT